MEQTLDRLTPITAQQVQEWRVLDFMKYLSCLHKANGSDAFAKEIFAYRYPRSLSLDLVTKAAVSVGTTTDATWAGALAVAKPLADAFLAFVRPMTLLGKIAFRKVPFNCSVAAQTTGGTYGWVGQGAPAGVTKADYATVSVPFTKASGIIIVTEELVTLSRPGAEAALRDELAAGLAEFLDAQLVNPTVAAVANVSPGSLTNGTLAIASSGTSAANAATDIKALVSQFFAVNPDASNAVLLLSPANAVALAIATGSSTLGMTGGSLYGVPAVTSTACTTNIVMVDAAAVLVADDGGLDISVSESALVQMNSAPDNPSTAATVYTSLFERNLVGLRATRGVTWLRARLTAVKYVSGASYV